MSHIAECIECGKQSISEDRCWKLGEVCLFGTLFACNLECARKWAEKNAREGYRPGEPNYDAEIVVPKETP